MKKVIILAVFLSSCKSVPVPECSNNYQKPDEEKKWTVQKVYQYLVLHNCYSPVESTAQVILESGWDLNGIGHNIIGMHRPTQRPTTNTAQSGIIAEYSSIESSLSDLLMWQCWTGYRSGQDYFNHLWKYKYNPKINYSMQIYEITQMPKFLELIEVLI